MSSADTLGAVDETIGPDLDSRTISVSGLKLLYGSPTQSTKALVVIRALSANGGTLTLEAAVPVQNLNLVENDNWGEVWSWNPGSSTSTTSVTIDLIAGALYRFRVSSPGTTYRCLMTA